MFTVPGMIVLGMLYLFYFILLDSIVSAYRLNNIGIILVNFALYSVLITGFLHGEIADYVLRPDNTLITTLIRIQCSFYPLFAFYLLRKVFPNRRSTISVLRASSLFFLFVAVISLSKTFGIIRMVETFQLAPFLSFLFAGFALIALFSGLHLRKSSHQYKNSKFELWSWLLLIISFIPGLPFFLIMLSLMIVVSLAFIFQKDFRSSSVA